MAQLNIKIPDQVPDLTKAPNPTNTADCQLRATDVLPTTGVMSRSFQVFFNRITSYLLQGENKHMFVIIPFANPGIYS